MGKTYQQQVDKQLKQFSNNKDYVEKYKNDEVLHKDVIVRIFKFVPETEIKKSILIPDDNGEFKPSSVVIEVRYFPLVQILNVGRDCDGKYEIGGVYTVPEHEIAGDDWNPQYLHLMQSFQMQGKQLVHVPENMKQKLPNVQINWNRYLYEKTWEAVDSKEREAEVYLIPESKLRTRVKV